MDALWVRGGLEMVKIHLMLKCEGPKLRCIIMSLALGLCESSFLPFECFVEYLIEYWSTRLIPEVTKGWSKINGNVSK